MSNHDELSTLVRRVPSDHVFSGGHVRICISNGMVVAPSWWKPSDETWLIDTRANLVGGVCSDVSVQFVEGEVARVDICYGRIHAIAGYEHLLVMALRGRDQPAQALQDRMCAMLQDAIGVTDSASNWKHIRHRLQGHLHQRIRAELGLDVQIDLPPAGRRGVQHYGPFVWTFPLRHIPTPQPFNITLSTDDDTDRLPEDVASDELARVFATLTASCSRCRIEDFCGAKEELHDMVVVALSDVLRPLARRITNLEMTPAAGVIPAEQRRLSLSLTAKTSDGELTFAIDLALKRVDADKARVFELHNEGAFEKAIESRIRTLIEAEVGSMPGHEVFLAEASLFDTVQRRLTTVLVHETGYIAQSPCLKFATARPVAPPRVLLEVPLQVQPMRAGQCFDFEIRARAALVDEVAWLRRGCVELEGTWSAVLRAGVEAAIHMLDDGQTIQSIGQLEAQLFAALATVAREDGYQLEVLKLSLLTMVPHSERNIHVTLRERFSFGPNNEPINLALTAELDVVDDLLCLTWSGNRGPDWAEALLRQIVGTELRFCSRAHIHNRAQDIRESIEKGFSQATALRGYRITRLVIVGMALESGASHTRERLEVTIPLQNGVDEARLEGWVEIELRDKKRWADAREPNPSDLVNQWAPRCLSSVCRKLTHGEVDTKATEIKDDFETELHQRLSAVGYAVLGVDGQLNTSNSPPQSHYRAVELECRVGQRQVSVEATVGMQLQSPNKWRASRVRDLDAWVEENARSVIRKVLLPKSFTEILNDVILVHKGGNAIVAEQISAELASRAAQIGYRVTQVLAFPDKEARDLLGGFQFELGTLEERTFGTALADREVEIEVHVSGRFDAFEKPEIKQMLARDVPVIGWLKARVRDALGILVRDVSLNRIFFHWHGIPDISELSSPRSEAREGASGEFARKLAARLCMYGVVDPVVQLVLHPPNYVEPIIQLCGSGHYPFRLVLPTRFHHRQYQYTAAIGVEGIDEANADKVFRRTKPITSEEISALLGPELATLLGQRSDGEIHMEDARGGDLGEMRRTAQKHTREYCIRHFGLLVTLCRLDRTVEEPGGPGEDAGITIDGVIRELEKRWNAAILAGSYDGVDGANAILARLARVQLEARRSQAEHARALTPGIEPTEALDEALLEPRRELVIIAPVGGYQSAEPGCFLEIAPTLHIRSRRHGAGFVSDFELEEVVRDALRAMLSEVEPRVFWLEFERQIGAAPPLHRSIRDGLTLALDCFRDRLDIQARVNSPARATRDRLTSMMRDFEINLGDVEIEGGRCKVAIWCRVTVDRTISGSWRRIEQSGVNAAIFEKWVRSWMKNFMFGVDRGALREPGVGSLMEAPITSAAAQQFGLAVRSSVLDVRVQPSRAQENARRAIAELEQRMDGLSGRSDVPALEAVSDLGAQIKELQKEVFDE